MRGTLALWWELEPGADDCNDFGELHVNIWSDLPRRHRSTLDIGLLIREGARARRIFVYIPAPVPRACVCDLSRTLEDDTTLSAVFNELLTIGARTSAGFDAQDQNGTQYHVAHIDVDNDIIIEPLTLTDGLVGTVLELPCTTIAKLSKSTANYIRLRVVLSRALERVFISKAVLRSHVSKLFL